MPFLSLGAVLVLPQIPHLATPLSRYRLEARRDAFLGVASPDQRVGMGLVGEHSVNGSLEPPFDVWRRHTAGCPGPRIRNSG